MRLFSGHSGTYPMHPPVGTSAYKAYQAAKRIDPGAQAKPWSFSPVSSSGAPLYTSVLGNTKIAGSSLDNYLSSALGATKPSSGPVRTPSSGAPSAGAPSTAAPSADAPSQPQLADYLDAPWASAYGMSRETAYSEAMENTAYRRSVADMQKAGLNPAVIFGAGNGYTAGSPSYVSSAPASSSGSGGSSGRSYGRGKSSGKLFSSSAYSVMSALGGIVGAAATKTAGGYWLGVSLTQGAMNAANLLSKR